MCGFLRKPIELSDTDLQTYQCLRIVGLTERQAAVSLRLRVPRLKRHTLLGVLKAVRKMELSL